MPLLDIASDVRAATYGDLPIRVMFRNGVEVWPKIGVKLAAVPTAWDRVDLTITPPSIGADSYILKRDGTQIYTGTGLTFTDTGRMPSTLYTYTVEAIKAGVTLPTTSITVRTPGRGDMGLVAVPTAYNLVSLSWIDPSGGADSYTLERGGTTIYTGPNKSFDDTGRSASTTYSYTLHAFRAGVELPLADTASATTPARPRTQKTSTLNAVSSTSYSGNANDNRYLPDYSNRADGRGWIFAGLYTYSNGVNFYGHQKAYWTFSIPAEIRNCISIDKVEISLWMEDVPLQNPAGSNFSVYVHHGAFQGGYPTALPGSTNAFATLHSMDLNWLGMTEWVDVTNYVCPGRTTVKEEFRVNGAHGFALTGLTNDPSDYGFAFGHTNAKPPRVRFTYTTWAA